MNRLVVTIRFKFIKFSRRSKNRLPLLQAADKAEKFILLSNISNQERELLRGSKEATENEKIVLVNLY